MPSQLSGTTSNSSNSYGFHINGTVDQGRSESFANDMQAAARTVGILAHSYNKKSEAMVAGLQEVCRASTAVSKPLCNGGTAPLPEKTVEHNGHVIDGVWNGGAHNSVPVGLNVASPKTKGVASNQDRSETSHCDGGRLICPKDGVQHASGLVAKKATELAAKQKVLQERVCMLERQIREKQLSLLSSHVVSQATFVEDRNQSTSRTGTTSVTDEVQRSASTPVGHLPFPLQVDGASDDAFLSQVSLPESDAFRGESVEVEEVSANCMTSRSRCDDSFSSLDSCATSGSSSSCSYLLAEGSHLSGHRAVKSMRVQAVSVSGTLDPDLTDTSSDEEEVAGGEGQQSRRTHLKHSWEKSRMAVGSRWMWLHRKIAELNKQIYLLDHHIKGACQQEHCVFGTHPLGILPLAAKATALTSRHSNTNGFSTANSRSHLSYLQHFLLPEALLGSKLHVKDLLTPSPLGQNLLCLDEGASARTRPLLRRLGSRKIVRRRRLTRVRGGSSLDPAQHSHLSLAHELPSRLLLDTVMKDILQEHSYAQLPLSKRRKAASCLPQLSTPQMHPLEPLPSTSPSPIHTPASLESSRGQARKRWNSLQQQASLESLSTASTLGGCGSPWSPGVSRPTTPSMTPGVNPGLTPLTSARKKKMANSTPLFDIDNIVIPYSIASSTRLEKLEYKEIITPRWRKIEDAADPNQTSIESLDCVDEDLSDEAFAKRHDRCEFSEKKRFMNFISGNNHKRRTRPHSVTLSESPAGADVNLTSPPQRRPTIASPVPTELELPRLPEVLPWQPREFPLSGEDEDALLNPPPPPPTIPSSPVRNLHTSTPSLSPSCTTSAYNTPLPSPLSTPVEDSPSGSPAEWVVNTQLNPASTGPSFVALHPLPRVFTSSPLPHHQPIILKLTKKT